MRPLVRGLVAAALLLSALHAITPAGASAVSAKSPKACKTLGTLQDKVRDLGAVAPEDFDGSAYERLGTAFGKASKDAPKKLKNALGRIADVYDALSDSETEDEALSRYNQLGRKDRKAFSTYFVYFGANCSSGATSTPSTPSSGGGGSLVLGDETIALDSARCYLREQTAAGQKIELTGQAYGTNAAGEAIILDFSRFAEESDFTGDDITVDIGDVYADDAIHLTAKLDIGGVARDGSKLQASNFELRSDDGSTTAASFEIHC